ncbi:MAG: TIGR03792 family protein, partial [Actinobacteria bacterium]|nr:TIGR03792 family protein [Actinomycetota bacterium]
MAEFRYTKGERLPIEVLVFEMSPEHVDEYLAIDHEVWTLGEAELPGFERIPFLSKEV